MLFACDALATPIEVMSLLVASVCDVTIPLPPQPKPLCPEASKAVTPVYALPVQDPTGDARVIRWLLLMSSDAPGETSTVRTTLVPAAKPLATSATRPPLIVSPA